MYKSSYLEANETTPSSLTYHTHTTEDNLPDQPDSFNCGIYSMFYESVAQIKQELGDAIL